MRVRVLANKSLPSQLSRHRYVRVACHDNAARAPQSTCVMNSEPQLKMRTNPCCSHAYQYIHDNGNLHKVMYHAVDRPGSALFHIALQQAVLEMYRPDCDSLGVA
jgi:hypothetical protein